METKQQEVYCNLLTKYALSVTEVCQPDIMSQLAAIKTGTGRQENYPDGTLLIEGAGTFDCEGVRSVPA